jgi:acyl-CoA hydrolase
VETRIERIGWEKSVKDLSNNCVFTFVNVDDDLRPQPVPTIFPTTYDEDARYLAAYRRNRVRASYKEVERLLHHLPAGNLH